LDCGKDPKNGEIVIPRLLRDAKSTDRNRYIYQVSGAVGAVLKMYGKIDADKLLKACNAPNHPS
jgi:hypothetical protein